jgi:hypothetical protein
MKENKSKEKDKLSFFSFLFCFLAFSFFYPKFINYKEIQTFLPFGSIDAEGKSYFKGLLSTVKKTPDRF